MRMHGGIVVDVEDSNAALAPVAHLALAVGPSPKFVETVALQSVHPVAAARCSARLWVHVLTAATLACLHMQYSSRTAYAVQVT